MTTGPSLDSVLVQWGERLFYPDNRIVRPDPVPRLDATLSSRAVVIRRRIEATVVQRAPQVVVKVTGGGPGMRAITAHLEYITREGSLPIEDDRGRRRVGLDALRDLADTWRYGGSLIREASPRQEALQLTLSMPHGTDPGRVLAAAREFARTVFADHRYVMVLHEHQANPHVHLTVKKESRTGTRLQSWQQLHRWREVFADKLREQGVEAEATPQTSRGENRHWESLWQARNRKQAAFEAVEAALPVKSGDRYFKNRAEAMQSWAQIMRALAASPAPEDRQLAQRIANFVRDSPYVNEVMGPRYAVREEPTRHAAEPSPQRDAAEHRTGPTLRR